jgi:hypothetical protein
MENEFGQHTFKFSQLFKVFNLKLLLQSITSINSSNQFSDWAHPWVYAYVNYKINQTLKLATFPKSPELIEENDI